MAETADYGTLAPLVAAVGSLIAAASAIIVLVWRGRRKWEPELNGIGIVSKRLAAIVVAIAIALLYARTRGTEPVAWLDEATVVALVLTVTAFIGYLVLYFSFVRDKDVSTNEKKITTRIVGGFCLTRAAGDARAKTPRPTIDEIFAGMQYVEDNVWPRACRVPVLVSIILLDIAMIAAGAVSLSGGAIILERALVPPIDRLRPVDLQGGPGQRALVTFLDVGHASAVLRLVGDATWTTNIPGPQGKFKITWGPADEKGGLISKNSLSFVMLPPGGQPAPMHRTDALQYSPPPGTTSSQLRVLIQVDDCSTDPPTANQSSTCSFKGSLAVETAR